MTSLTDLTPIAACIISLAIAVVTVFVIPLLRKRYGDEVVSNATNILYQIGTWVEIFVEAAEQLFPEPKSGETKKQYVIAHMKEKLAELGYTLDFEALEALIEREVFNMNRSKNFPIFNDLDSANTDNADKSDNAQE